MLNRNFMKKMAEKIRKAGKTALCAVLAGSLVFGGVHAYSYLGSFDVQAADTERVYMKTKKVEEKENSDFTRTTQGMDVSDLVEYMMPSVVSITTKSLQEVQDYYGMFDFWYGYTPGNTQREVSYSGSGFIVGENDTELLIVTNNHLVDDATTVSICFCDNEAYEGKVKGYDEKKDVAIVSVKKDDISDDTYDAIKIATVGSSDDLKVGEQVVVIGNALGYGQSVTTGIVSAKNRQIDQDDKDNDVKLIQTDAAINPGNSGGPLVNMDGEVVGIASSKLAGTVIESMCYAIAISDVQDILTELMNMETREKVGENHGYLGVTVTTISKDVSKAYGIPTGIFVSEVQEDSAAEKAGITARSVITKVDGRTVKTAQDLVSALEYYEVGEEVTLTVAVPDGAEYTESEVKVTLQKNKSDEKDADDEEEDDDDDEDDDEEKGGWPFNFGWNDDDDEDDDDDGRFGEGTFGDWH